VQKPHPPLRIAANSPETAVFAGEQGYPVFIASPINTGGKLGELPRSKLRGIHSEQLQLQRLLV
jgi:alkanesulfonate monooxygenase SsuD/methylene tetrahydromethanopterin reductase-like flavin-dependent oxidoreductase (luciferase family)